MSGVPRPRQCVLQSGAPRVFSHHDCIRDARHSCASRVCVLCDLCHGLCGARRALIHRYDHAYAFRRVLTCFRGHASLLDGLVHDDPRACVLFHAVRETVVFLGH